MGTLDAAHFVASGESILEEVGLTGGQALTVAGSLMTAIGFLGRKIFTMHQSALEEKDEIISYLKTENEKLQKKVDVAQEDLTHELKRK